MAAICFSAWLAMGAGPAAASVHPAECEPNLAAMSKLWINAVTIDLEDALEAGKMAEQALGFAVGCIDIGDPWRIEPTPGPVVGGIGPKLAGLGAPSTGIEHRHRRLIGEQLGPRAKHREKALMQRAQMEGGMPNPVRQCRSVEMDALAGIDLGMPLEWQMIGIFGHQNLGDGCLRRQSALDQPGRSVGLPDAVFTNAAGVFGTPGDGNAELRRHHVQPRALVLADPVQLALAAGAGLIVDVDDDLDPRQMRR